MPRSHRLNAMSGLSRSISVRSQVHAASGVNSFTMDATKGASRVRDRHRMAETGTGSGSNASRVRPKATPGTVLCQRNSKERIWITSCIFREAPTMWPPRRFRPTATHRPSISRLNGRPLSCLPRMTMLFLRSGCRPAHSKPSLGKISDAEARGVAFLAEKWRHAGR
jgi:hypothetical protein